MDFDAAIRAHAEWKIKLSTYIKNPDGSLKASEISPDNKCPLGKWIYESVNSNSGNQAFMELKDTHAKFHKCAAQVVTDADSGKNMSSAVSLGAGTDYAKLSSDIVQKIMSIRKEFS